MEICDHLFYFVIYRMFFYMDDAIVLWFFKDKMWPMDVARPLFPIFFGLRNCDCDFFELLNYYIYSISPHNLNKNQNLSDL